MSIVEVVRKTTTVVEVAHPGVQGPPGDVGTGGAVSSVNSRTGAVVLTSADVGLANVNNTSDANKPVSTAQAAADAAVLASANATTAAHSGRTDNPHATTAAQVGADAAGTAAASVAAHVAAADPHTQYAKTSALAAVATSGAYADLTGRPTLGTAAALNIPATGNAAAGEVVKGNDSRMTDARAPTAHTHPSTDINDSTVAGRALLTAADATAQRTALGVPSGSGTSTGANTGDQTITLTGEATGTGTGSFAVTLANSAIIGKVLTGLSTATNAVITAADSILSALGNQNVGHQLLSDILNSVP